MGSPVISRHFLNFEATAYRLLGCKNTGTVNATNSKLLIPGGKKQVATPSWPTA